ncbi:hypothetical protein Tco_1300748 [Tanacetum coccineum]
MILLLTSRSHFFYWARYMVSSVALWPYVCENSEAGNEVGFTQLALFGGGTYFEPLVYILEQALLVKLPTVDPNIQHSRDVDLSFQVSNGGRLSLEADP